MNINQRIDEMKDNLIKATQEITRIKSVQGEPTKEYPFGEGPAKALKYALELSKKLGFKVVNLDNYVGYAEYGEGDDYVAVLGHLDVVPEGDGWKYPPYSGEIHDGKIYARGTLDDKGPMMAALYGLEAVKACGLKLNKRVRIIFGTNEETGIKEVEYYLKREKAPVSGFTPDAEYPIINGEKGITIFNIVKDLNIKPNGDISIVSIKGGNAPNMVPDRCDAILSVKDPKHIVNLVEKFSKETGYDLKAKVDGNKVIIKSVGVSAHGSLPHLGKNAIMQLFEFLGKLNIEKCDVKDFIDFMNDNVGMETDGRSFGVYLEDKESGKLSFNVGVVDITENKAVMALNLRYPVTKKLDDMINPFNDKIKGTGIRIENFVHQKPLYFEPTHPLIKTLKKVYEEQTGKEAKLLSIGGGTYAKEMPNIVAFGPIFPGKPDLDHQANEYIEIEDLIMNAKIYGHAIYELAK